MTNPFNPNLPPPIVKIKADNEKLQEKVKIEDENFKLFEKPPKEKFEKSEKHEFKEHKLELKEHKNEIKEVKGDKEKDKEKELKENKLEIKEAKIEKIEREEIKPIEQKVVKENKEAEVPGFEQLRVSPLIDRDMLMRHADALEAMGRELRHFIEAGDRPDLSRGALHEEPDQRDDQRDDNR
ncbi:hypothetical protein [Blastococcus sp. VKM Ac-2987]|uniref:hypothetical protein n=1 Tax=Blastococcus sp. VKM Ac-2987 TaxID=3004141 RepID=UPI0022AB9480|nr:hypothetical protein [Blastococcus sp. VKM Ac-2987]MCZ2860707.1 hypothetical protein [Blastococcus sp. VKM Ac-2987]